MFIHWGPVALTGKEISWSRANTNPKCPNNGDTPADVYDNLYKQFDPVKFDAREWVAIAHRAGMRYMVFTAKHCDGFLEWKSDVSPYNIGSTPFKRDVCDLLASAAHKAHMPIGWYFSPMDWRDPDFRTDRNGESVARMQAELKELLTNYGKIAVVWFDWDGREAPYDQPDTYAIVKKLAPNAIINNRLDLGPDNNNTQMLSPYADYYTPEQNIGAYDDMRPWETCMTLGDQWSWKPNDRIKTASQVIGILAQCVGGDGNLLLDTGPMPDGRSEPRHVDVLNQVGDWLKKNGAAVYGTRGGPFKPNALGASTRSGNKIYLHVLQWPAAGLHLPPIDAKIVSAKLLSGPKVDVDQQPTGITVAVPVNLRDPSDTVIVCTLDRPALSILACDGFAAGR